MALLPQFGTPQQFETVRRLLRNLHFDEASVCARTGFPSIFKFQALSQGRTSAADLNDGLDALIRLLLDGEPVSEVRMRYLLPGETVEALESLSLIVRIGGQGDYFGTVRLFPVEGLHVASDRIPPLDPEMLLDGSDTVFSPSSWNTEEFLKGLPRGECEDLLDLCCGSAVEALVCARTAGHVWATDLTARSIHFAEFNCRLNGIENVTCVQSDLYAAVKDRTFDRIVAHPPYVPAHEEEVLIYRDGGRDGEQVLRGIVEGLPRYLRPAGVFYAFVMSSERAGGTLTDRIRQWLGAQASEFEISIAITGGADMKLFEGIRQELAITTGYFARMSITRK